MQEKKAVDSQETTYLRGCLKRVVPGIVCRQETAKTLNFEDISLRPRYNLRRSLAFQTPSNPQKGYFSDPNAIILPRPNCDRAQELIPSLRVG